jgi:hypothetical protein
MRATDSEDDKAVFAAYRAFLKADAAAAEYEDEKDHLVLIEAMHERYRRFISMPSR